MTTNSNLAHVAPNSAHAEERIASSNADAEVGAHKQTHDSLPAQGHNFSSQGDVDTNPDLALHYSHEHQHNHMHHGRASIAGRHDDIVYSKGDTMDKHDIGGRNPQDYNTHHLRDGGDRGLHTVETDAEKGGMSAARLTPTDESSGSNDGKKHRFSRMYRKYKIFFHLFIWLVFTGSVYGPCHT